MSQKESSLKQDLSPAIPQQVAEVHIPDPKTPYKEQEAWAIIEGIISNTRRVLLFGPPATGKTHIGTYSQEGTVYSVTMTEATPDAELRGHFVPAGEGKFKWMDGPAIKAWREGARLVINEINRASPEALSFLYVLLDDPKTARITLPTGETVTAEPGFSCVATMNGTPDELPEALADRFPVTVEVAKTHPNAVDSLPEEFRPLARKTVNLKGERRISIRTWKAFADAWLKGVDVDIAGQATFAGRWSDVRDAILVALASAPSKKYKTRS